MVFAGAAVLLAGIGIYGLVARSVAARVREFGVRSALGATPGMMLRLVLGQGLRVTGIGLAGGLLAAAIAARSIQSLLFGVAPTAPHTFAFAAIVLGAIAFAGTAVPAWRASRVDPIVALREQ
jgi:ABC-type antimicrobial peptide transport system permease subunit